MIKLKILLVQKLIEHYSYIEQNIINMFHNVEDIDMYIKKVIYSI